MADDMCEWEGISPLRAVWLTWANIGGDEVKQCFLHTKQDTCSI